MPSGALDRLDLAALQRLQTIYRRRWGLEVYVVDTQGRVLEGSAHGPCRKDPACAQTRAIAATEAMRWGEPSVVLCPQSRMLWAVPLMHNAWLTGALVAGVCEQRVFPPDPLDVRQAAEHLQALAAEANLTNAALLAQHRNTSLRERHRAEAIHEVKLLPYLDLREMYQHQEPALLSAVRRDDLPAAREILNQLLTAIYFRAAHRLGLIKSFLMELIVMLTRTAVEAGGNAEELLGQKFDSLSVLAGIETETKLASWLHEMLERCMESIRLQHRSAHQQTASQAVAYMQRRCGEMISRDQVAEAVGVSPSHFSRLLHRQTGRTFTDLLSQMRTQRAAELLVRTDWPLAKIALESGFSDQSYFTKVFRKHQGMTPGSYRRRRKTL
jgi:AraC-like DNA-binding protein